MAEYDVSGVRGLYASLADAWTYLNAHEYPLIPEKVAAGVARAFRSATNPLPLESKVQGDLYIAAAQEAIADFVGTNSASCVLIGPSLDVLYRDLMRAMRPLFRYGGGAVLSSFNDARLNEVISDTVKDIRWAYPDLGTGELPAEQFDTLVDGTTRLVSIAAAHPLIGNIAPVAEIVEISRDRTRGWVLVDASAYAPYCLVDFDAWDADILAIDLQKLGGPQLAALVFRDASMLKRLDRTQFATPISAGLAGGIPRLVEHFATLVPEHLPNATRRQRLETSIAALERYQTAMARDLITFIGSLPAVHIMGASGEVAVGMERKPRIPRMSFAVHGVPTETVYRRLLDNHLLCALTPPDALLSEMGAEELGGTITVALGPYSTGYDVDHLTRVVASLA
ncbi:aminotransferase class V-fold PLP-dependent enzyme [Corynebacterium caspium]|uniref:aminotransferase class V-fold PLP-dependent enzyme n=1 Tax=Corynebacterium caspium TaxID=234828 RepID=UPI000367880F|nr:aminotransferase class V-fold PLP-dependent enzyme [Corynebacterium caspium]WKD58519.1 bifunctional cysteine desulfurase/selenocysteine lyase [Corynebacterium caspium DSM 44850]